jgi:predicted acyltransferase
MQLQVKQGGFIEAPISPVHSSQRVVSVDALRGFDIFWILGGDGAIWALDEMTRDKGPVIGTIGHALSYQMEHASWDGFRFYDFIFPLFIFVTGVAIVFSLPPLVEKQGLRSAYIRIIRRSLILYGLGLIYYGGISQHWNDIRYLGVLQRVGICYLFASILFLNLNLRGLLATFVALLLGYWALMTFVPVPGIGPANYAPDTNFANWVDAHYLPGRLCDTTRDPEGLLSSLPAIATCLIGVFAGMLLKDRRFTAQGKSLVLIGAGITVAAAGYLWSLQLPLIKQLWTSSFVLVAGGYSLMLLGAWHHVIDVRGFRRWPTIFVWIGTNAITLYIINNVMSFERFATRFVGGDFGAMLDRLVTPGTGRLLSQVLGLAFAVALAGFLYRRKIFLRV